MEGIRMMIAILKNEQLIYASEVATLNVINEIFYCPECRKEVILKKSKKGRYFFSHTTACGQDTPKTMPVESDEHKIAKKLLVRELSTIKDAKVYEEKYVRSVKQTADTYIKLQSSRQLIYEYQRSIIAANEVLKRQQNYSQQVDQVYWLLDYEKSLKLPLHSQWLQTMLNYSKDLGYHLYFLDLAEEVIVRKFQLPVLYQKNMVEYFESHHLISEHASSVKSKKINKVIESAKLKVDPTDPVYYLREIKGIMSNLAYRQDIYNLYEEGVILSEQPEWVFTEKWQLLLVETPSWLAILWAFVALKPFDQGVFSASDYTESLKATKGIRLNPLPLVEIDPYHHLSEALVQLLVMKGLIVKLPSGLLETSYWSDNSAYDTLEL